MSKSLRGAGLVGLCLAFLYACGGGDGDGTPAPGTPGAPPGAATIAVGGVAAAGAALDGATVEVRGPDGNPLALGDVVTGSNGSYQVDIPVDTALPLLIIITPPGGDPVRTIIPAIDDGATSITANVNPLTELVANEVIGAFEADPATLATSLATVANDPTVVQTTGNTLVGNLLGAGATYASFANDPDFVAASGDGAIPSVTDTLLDTLQRQAAGTDQSLAEFLAAAASADVPPRLLESPEFQVRYAGELIKQGNDPTTLVQRLTDAGAITPLADGDTTDVFREILAAMPTLLATADTNTASLDGRPALKGLALNSAIDTLAALVAGKDKRFGATGDELETLLGSGTIIDTVLSIVTSTITPILEDAAVRGDGGDGVLASLTKLLATASKSAGTTLSAFENTALGTTDVSALVTSFLQNNVLAPDISTLLDGFADGTLNEEDLITALGDVSEVGGALNILLQGNPTLLEGGPDALDGIVASPPGAWNTSDWNEFDWAG